MIVTIAPIILGKGIPLFGAQAIEQKLNYSETEILSNGYVQIKYTKQSLPTCSISHCSCEFSVKIQGQFG